MFALLVFLTGSIASSLAWSAASLIAFRALQGIGGGLMLPLLSTLVMQAAAGKSLGRTMSVVSLPAILGSILGSILGPVLGGVILSWLDWRWMFWVNFPFCVAGFLLAWKMLPTDSASSRPWLDVVGHRVHRYCRAAVACIARSTTCLEHCACDGWRYPASLGA